MILIHAFRECGTVSDVYEQGKLSILKLLKKSKAEREEAYVFLAKGRTPEAIFKAGIRIFVELYG